MVDSLEIIQAACTELANQIPGIQADFDGDLHLRLTDPAIIADFSRLCHRSVREIPTPPALYEPKITLYENEGKSCFPWLSPFNEYLGENQSVLEDEVVVSFVEGTGTKSTNKTYLCERRSALDDQGIDRDRQILVLLDNRIPEHVTQKLAVYYLTTKGWMVVEDGWYSPNLRFDRFRHSQPFGYGVPDIVAWRSELISELAERGWIRGGGTIHELACLSVREPFSETTLDPPTGERTLTGEVKGSKRSLGEAIKQLYDRGSSSNHKPGYLRSNCFDEGYGIVPLQRGRDHEGGGVISFDEQGFFAKKDPVRETFLGDEVEERRRANSEKKQQLISNLDTVALQTLLCNVSMADALDLAEVDDDTSPSGFLRQLQKTPRSQVIGICEDIIG